MTYIECISFMVKILQRIVVELRLIFLHRYRLLGASIGRSNDGWNIILMEFHISKINIIHLDLSPISVLETQILIGLHSKGLSAEHGFRRRSKDIVL